jgi:hypothetical protein
MTDVDLQTQLYWQKGVVLQNGFPFGEDVLNAGYDRSGTETGMTGASRVTQCLYLILASHPSIEYFVLIIFSILSDQETLGENVLPFHVHLISMCSLVEYSGSKAI